MVDEWEVPELALRQARKTARRAHTQCRGLIEYPDLVSIGYEWIAKHPVKVRAWCDKEQNPSGWKALGKSMLRYMNREVAKERSRRTGAKTEDAFYYTPGLIQDTLPDVWDLEDRLPTDAAPSDTPKGKSMPSEGGNRAAVLADVSAAVERLHDDERHLLQARYYSGLTIGEMARMRGVSEDTIERRLRLAIQSVNDYLGGESPWRRRKSKSNAAAIAETRSQWEGEGQ